VQTEKKIQELKSTRKKEKKSLIFNIIENEMCINLFTIHPHYKILLHFKIILCLILLYFV